MESITKKSYDLALEYATILWALASTVYPRKHDLLINVLSIKLLEISGIFALNCRRVLEQFPRNKKFTMTSNRWRWESMNNKTPKVIDLWDATNYIIHAKSLKCGIEILPEHLSFIKEEGNSAFVPYILVETDKKEPAYIDLFSMAYCFLYDVTEEFQLLLTNNDYR